MVQFGPLPVLDYRLFFARNTISYLCKKSIVYLKPMAQWDITEDYDYEEVSFIIGILGVFSSFFFL